MSVSIFFCYAHEDEDLLNKLKRHLWPLQRQGLIAVWHDRRIGAGQEWADEIDTQDLLFPISFTLDAPLEETERLLRKMLKNTSDGKGRT